MENNVRLIDANALDLRNRVQTDMGGLGFCPADLTQRRQAKLAELYPPEFLGRIDCIAQFSPLGREELRCIAGGMLRQLQERAQRHRVQLQLDDQTAACLAERCCKSPSGARDLRHQIQQTIEEPAARLMLEHRTRPLCLQVSCSGSNLTVTAKN